MNELPAPVPGVETVPDGESAQIKEIADLMIQLLEQRYLAKPPFLRGVHPKAHGCATATFTIREDIPTELQLGVFAHPGESYDAVIRFSNAAALVGPDVFDTEQDGVRSRAHGSRGMAIKVRGLPGKSLADDEPDTQDFLMVNFPVFPFANVADYLLLSRLQLEHADDSDKFVPAFAAALIQSGGGLRAQATGLISTAIRQIAMADPLASRYFSAAPFMFGADRVMKFGVLPTPDQPLASLPDQLDGDYLRLALAERLREGPATFDFFVQTRPPTAEAHIEDVTQEWKEADVPFRTVATVSIPQQEIDCAQAAASCESLFYTPWHSMPEHRPVGGINRLRFATYLASFEWRRREPNEIASAIDQHSRAD